MCRIYGVSRDGFNSWRQRGESARSIEDEKLFILIDRIFKDHNGSYGSPKITSALRVDGVAVGQKRVARIMRDRGLVAKKAKLYPGKKSSNGSANASPNIIFDLNVTRPDQLWVGDVTYIKLDDGEWRYLSVIMDRYTRQIISWSVSCNRDAALTCGTLQRAMRNRGYPSDVIFHSDKGSEYIATEFKRLLSVYGIQQSMNRKNKMNDNAHMESFFNSFKIEPIRGVELKCERVLRRIASKYTRYYNKKRIHMSLGGISPNAYELQYYA